MNSLEGQLLVASPKLLDPNFFHSVLLMIHHNEEGALGLVLNRPLSMSVRDAWLRVSESSCEVQGVLHQGGPCEGPLMVVHTRSELSQTGVTDGIHFTTEKDAIEKLVADNQGAMRFFVGYAGWAAGQLENELKTGSWLSLPATAEHIFESGEDQWDLVIKAISRAATMSWIDPKMMPEDPSMN